MHIVNFEIERYITIMVPMLSMNYYHFCQAELWLNIVEVLEFVYKQRLNGEMNGRTNLSQPWTKVVDNEKIARSLLYVYILRHKSWICEIYIKHFAEAGRISSKGLGHDLISFFFFIFNV